MKVLHLNTNDNFGGAARAAYRLHQALNTYSKDIKSEMLVLKKGTDDPNVHKLSNSLFHKARPFLDTIHLKRYPNRKKVSFSGSLVPFSGIVDKINELNPDIVHLHWINAGLIRIEDLEKIEKPIVWSLHDMWAFTGGCHIDLGCGKYKEECGACPILKSHKQNDLSKKVFQRKKKAYSNIKNLTIVGLSKWICECAEKSTLFNGCKIVNLPNPIDTSVFRTIDKSVARQLLSLNHDKKYILFGAMNATSDPNKGFHELNQALSNLNNDNNNIELIIFGASGSGKYQNYMGIPLTYLGRLYDDVTLKLMYNAADVVVVPSKQENLSNVIMESLSCGTPVVGFDIGGNPDLIEHRINGYLAKPFDNKSLLEGIKWVLDLTNSPQLTNNVRKKIIDKYSYSIVSKRYNDLYKKCLLS